MAYFQGIYVSFRECIIRRPLLQGGARLGVWFALALCPNHGRIMLLDGPILTVFIAGESAFVSSLWKPSLMDSKDVGCFGRGVFQWFWYLL